jgi:hypothetical protein
VTPTFVVRSPAEGAKLIKHAEITANHKRSLKVKPKHRTAVLVPCAGTKPFPQSPSHKHGYLPALEGRKADVYVVSEPLGVVPYAWSDTYPNNAYDFPPTHLRGAAFDLLVERVGEWMDKVGARYKRIVLALPSHHMRLVRAALQGRDLPVEESGVSECKQSGVCAENVYRATHGAYSDWLGKRVKGSSAKPSLPQRLYHASAHAQVIVRQGFRLRPAKEWGELSEWNVWELGEGVDYQDPSFRNVTEYRGMVEQALGRRSTGRDVSLLFVTADPQAPGLWGGFSRVEIDPSTLPVLGYFSGVKFEDEIVLILPAGGAPGAIEGLRLLPPRSSSGRAARGSAVRWDSEWWKSPSKRVRVDGQAARIFRVGYGFVLAFQADLDAPDGYDPQYRWFFKVKKDQIIDLRATSKMMARYRRNFPDVSAHRYIPPRDRPEEKLKRRVQSDLQSALRRRRRS